MPSGRPRWRERLAGAIGAIASTDDALAFARLAAHVYGEHLGRFDDGIALLERDRRAAGGDGRRAGRCAAPARRDAALRERRRRLPCAARDRRSRRGARARRPRRSPDVARSRRRSPRIARRSRSPLAGCRPARRRCARWRPAATTSPRRSRRSRRATPTRRSGMVEAAEGGLRYWKQAGTWLEEERARIPPREEPAAGRPRAATRVAAARRCLDVCERNDAPAFERFFALRRAGGSRSVPTARRPRPTRPARAAARCSTRCRPTSARGARPSCARCRDHASIGRACARCWRRRHRWRRERGDGRASRRSLAAPNVVEISPRLVTSGQPSAAGARVAEVAGLRGGRLPRSADRRRRRARRGDHRRPAGPRVRRTCRSTSRRRPRATSTRSSACSTRCAGARCWCTARSTCARRRWCSCTA